MVLRLSGTAKGYSEPEVDAALDILDNSLVVKKAFLLWLHWGPVQKLKDMGVFAARRRLSFDERHIYSDPADDERCAGWAGEMIAKLKPVSNGSQMNDENIPLNKGPYLSKAAAARQEVMRAKYDPQRRFVSFLT